MQAFEAFIVMTVIVLGIAAIAQAGWFFVQNPATKELLSDLVMLLARVGAFFVIILLGGFLWVPISIKADIQALGDDCNASMCYEVMGHDGDVVWGPRVGWWITLAIPPLLFVVYIIEIWNRNHMELRSTESQPLINYT